MKRFGRRRLLAEANVIPFVDVMLVLLVIFMVAVPVVVQGLAVNLPVTQTVEAMPEHSGHVVVTLKADGAVYLDEYPARPEELADRIAALALAEGKAVYLRADRGVPYGDVVLLMDKIKRAGVSGLNLVTETGDASGGSRNF